MLTDLKALAKYYIGLHGEKWYAEASPELESIPTFSGERFVAAATPVAVLGLIMQNEVLREQVAALSAIHVRYTWLRKQVDQPYSEFVAVTQNIGHDWIVVHDLDRAVDQMIEEEQP